MIEAFTEHGKGAVFIVRQTQKPHPKDLYYLIYRIPSTEIDKPCVCIWTQTSQLRERRDYFIRS